MTTTNDSGPQTVAGREQAERVARRRDLLGNEIPPSVQQAWTAVMNDVQSVAKTGFAKSFGEGGGGFRFRGVDAVVDAVGPALRTHGVTVLPHKILSVEAVEYETKRGGRMINKQVRVRWKVIGPCGDSFTGESVGEAADAGDKAISKAQSVAYRVFLLQALCIPTGETDPDENVHERASRGEGELNPQEAAEVAAADEARAALLAKTEPFGFTAEKLLTRFWDDYRKNLRNTRNVELIEQFGEALIAEAKAATARGEVERDTVAAAQAADAGQPEPPITPAQMRSLHVLFKENNIPEDEHHQWLADALGIPVETKKNLTTSEADRAITKLKALAKAASTTTEGK